MTIAGTHSSRRINVLISQLGFRRYLEVGVAKGATFLAVSADYKVAVDPRFQFDYQSQGAENVRFFQTTSDEYFASLAAGECFDFIFLDGLHTFEQTFRDFCASFSYAHRHSVWLIDDTVPNDPYSAWPNLDEALRFRAESGNPSRAWHGDVYKIVFAIHDFFPNLSYCTINTNGNPQTLAWMQARSGFKPKYNSLELISRLSYFDFKKNADVMKYCEEQRGLAMAVEAQASKPAGTHRPGARSAD